MAMAAGGRLRRRIIGSGVLIVAALGLCALIFRDALSLEYHKRGLLSAKARHWRLTTRGYSFWDHVSEIARGRPVAADDVVATWKHHEDALVQRGFLTREVYVSRQDVLPSRSTDRAYNDALARMEASCRWWSISRVETNLLVTACARGHAEWRVLATKLGLVLKEEPSQTAEKPKKRCWRKCKKLRQDETLAASLASGYSIDDESYRAFMGRRGRVAGGVQP